MPTNPGDDNRFTPGLAAVNTRLRALRVDLDRLDDAIDLLDRPERVELTRHSLHARSAIDSLEAAVDKLAAGL
jgi:hypothetical protein